MGNVLFVTSEDRADRLRDGGESTPAPMPQVEHVFRGAGAAGAAVPLPAAAPGAPVPVQPLPPAAAPPPQ